LEKDVALKVEQTLLKVSLWVYHPAEVGLLIGNSAIAKDQLDWKAKTMLEQLYQGIAKAHFSSNSKELFF
jgi:GDP-D-mannose dehydratase